MNKALIFGLFAALALIGASSDSAAQLYGSQVYNAYQYGTTYGDGRYTYGTTHYSESPFRNSEPFFAQETAAGTAYNGPRYPVGYATPAFKEDWRTSSLSFYRPRNVVPVYGRGGYTGWYSFRGRPISGPYGNYYMDGGRPVPSAFSRYYIAA